MDGKEKLTQVRTAMLLHTPFFASILLDMMNVQVGKFPNMFPPGNETAATDGKNIWFDEDFLSKLKLPEAVFVMCHEVGHAMWMHMSRGKHFHDTIGPDGLPFDAARWNRAGDYVINDMLTKSKVGRMPESGLLSKDYTADMLVDDVYKKLKNDPKDGNGQSTLDVHVLSPGQLSKTEWARVVRTAADAAKSQGKLPEVLDRFVDKLLNPVVPWQEKLRHQISRCAGRDATTWSKPHRRRLITQNVVMPSYTGFAAGHVVFVVDTSGSMGPDELAQALGECDKILQDCSPEAVTLIGCDAEINSTFELYAGDSLAANPPELKGGGGTSFRPPFKWVEDEGVRPACLVYFTDMYGDFPKHEPEYPVIWCSSTPEKVAPFGETIYVEFKK
jgi:predicted metal-dependent peptidase